MYGDNFTAQRLDHGHIHNIPMSFVKCLKMEGVSFQRKDKKYSFSYHCPDKAKACDAQADVRIYTEKATLQ
jgi:hypothetical protein